MKRYLGKVEETAIIVDIQAFPREYRREFSSAYRVLYKMQGLEYLVEIIDSAQEAFSQLWVNGEKYEFTEKVSETAIQLISCFRNLNS